MEISLKTGIEHRFSLRKLKSTVWIHVLLGKLRNSSNFPMEFWHRACAGPLFRQRPRGRKKDGGKRLFSNCSAEFCRNSLPQRPKRQQNRVWRLLMVIIIFFCFNSNILRVFFTFKWYFLCTYIFRAKNNFHYSCRVFRWNSNVKLFCMHFRWK